MNRYSSYSFVAILITFLGMGVGVVSASEVDTVSQFQGHWSLYVWYALSIVLALIGFVAAKTRN